jgi:hypothetical protein
VEIDLDMKACISKYYGDKPPFVHKDTCSLNVKTNVNTYIKLFKEHAII